MTEVVFANGLMDTTELELCFNNLPLRGTPLVSPESPCYIVGLIHTEGEGIGAWVDDALYLDPVLLCFTTLEEATSLAQKNKQKALFKMTGVCAEKEVVCDVSDTIEPVIDRLREFSQQYGGATAVFVGYTTEGNRTYRTYRVFAGEGEVVYL